MSEYGQGGLLDKAVPPCGIAAIHAAVLVKWGSHSVNFDFGIPEEEETMVARMLFVSQLTLSNHAFDAPNVKLSIYAKLGRTSKKRLW